MRRYSIRKIKYLWSIRNDFPKWHLVKSFVLGWTPMPDRFFVATTMSEFRKSNE